MAIDISPLTELDPEVAWKPWAPSDREPWDARRVRHLLRRAGFGGTAAQVKQCVGLGPSETIDWLLGKKDPRGLERFEEDSAQLASAVRAGGNIDRIAAWWLHRMIHTPSPLVEKMTLFWHGHFATGAEKVNDTELMVTQNQLLRRFALGDFRKLVHEVSKDPAMLLYLDSASNRKAHPNENYARELMELFCLGEGNYSEQDVQELARCFTGWEIRRKSFRFNPYQHDSGKKTILGKTDIESGEAAIDVVLDHPKMPLFIAGKLYRFFVCDEPQPSEALLQPLADKFSASNHQMEPLVRTMLSSNLLLSDWSIGKKIRSPIELMIEWMRDLEITTNLDRIAKGVEGLGQALFNPPNVKGWDGGRAWINSSTLIARANLIVDLLRDPATRFGGTNLEGWLKTRGVSNVSDWSDWLESTLLAVPLSKLERERLDATSMESAKNNEAWASRLVALSQTPKLQLA